MTAIFDQLIFESEETDNIRIENSIVRNILNDEKMGFPAYTDHISISNTAGEIKQQSIDEKNLFIEIELKRNKRDFETLENLMTQSMS